MILKPINPILRTKLKQNQFTKRRNRYFTTQNEENVNHKEYQSRTKRSSRFRHDYPSFLEVYHNLTLPNRSTGLGVLAFFAVVSSLLTSQYSRMN